MKGGIPGVPTGWSLRLRLVFFFAIFLLAAWIAAGFFAWRASRAHIDRFFDTQQMLFAKTLAASDLSFLTNRLPKTKKVVPGGPKEHGKQDKNALGFAVFSAQGDVLLSDGEKGDNFIFTTGQNGFSTTYIMRSKEPWRMVWMTSPDGERLVAVGQEEGYRQRMAFAMLSRQLLPWLLLLPVLVLGLLWMLSRELRPLRSVVKALEARSPRDTAHISPAGIPTEVTPLVRALNNHFDRTGITLARERAFISDAAHELRTPLAGLRVQAEVVRLSTDDPEGLVHATGRLISGIDRCSRLIEQLLTLSRMDALTTTDADRNSERVIPDWPVLIAEAMAECKLRAEVKDISLTYAFQTAPEPKPGHPPLLGILIRNLLDNAVKYTPENGSIHLTLDRHFFRVENSCPSVPDETLSRLGERFYRPPGQKETGSGLGLAIAGEIAADHGYRLSWWNAPIAEKAPGFAVQLYFL